MLSTARGKVTVALVAAVLAGGSASALQGHSSPARQPAAAASRDPRDPARPVVLPAGGAARSAKKAQRVPRPLTRVGVSLRAGPVAVPLVLEIPSIGVAAPMVGVGVTPKNVMDAPEGALGSPAWQQAFWYRGSAVPGAISTALIAGHIDGPGGSAAVFGRVHELRAGDKITVHDTRNGLNVRFAVTAIRSYSLAEASSVGVLRSMYGAGPVAGTWPTRSVDGKSHLTLVTCSGTFDLSRGTHDHRLAVYAVRIA
jgi:sortase (surface protein transpeptidase)